MHERTVRSRSTEPLAHADELSPILLEHSDCGILIIHSDGMRVELNAQGRRILGYLPDEISNLTIFDLVPLGTLDAELLRHNSSSIQTFLKEARYLRQKAGGLVRVDIQMLLLTDGRVVMLLQMPAYQSEDQLTLRTRAQNFRALAEASHAFAQASRDYQAVLELVVQKLVELLGDICSIRLLSEDEQWLDMVAIYGVEPQVTEQFRQVMEQARLGVAEQDHIHRIIQTGEPLLWPYISMERIHKQAKAEYASSLQQLGTHGVIVVPLRDQDRVIGVLYVLRYLPHHQRFTQDDVTLAQNLADRAALSIVNARLYGDLQTELQRRQQAELLLSSQNHVLEEIATGVSLSHILDEIVQSVEEQVPGSICSILSLNSQGTHLYSASASSLPPSYNQSIDGVAIGPNVGSCATAAYLGEPVIVSDIATDPLWEGYRELALSHNLRACWSYPIFSSDKKVLGTFALYHHAPYAPTPQQQDLVASAAHLAGVAMERDRAAQSLRESEQRFRALVDASAQIVWTHDAQGHPMKESPSWYAFTGQTKEDGAGTGWLNALHPNDQGRIARTWQTAVAAQQPYSTEYRLRHVSGEWRWMAVRAVPLHNEDGSLRAWVGMNSDITERKKAEAARQQLEDQLHQAQRMESIGQLAGGVAHDFNNILTVIQMYSDLIQARMSPENPLRAKVQQIRLASQRASALTGQLLAFSRKQMLAPTVVDINTLFRQLRTMLDRLIGEDILIVTSLQPDIWSVTADPSQLEQVILNLVVNARDAMPKGGTLTIETRNVYHTPSSIPPHNGDAQHNTLNDSAPAYVMLSVIDTGSGMDAQTQSRIFEPFFTTKAETKRTGLGLSTVHGIVKQSGGDIAVHSHPGSGTTFRIYLPASKEAPRALQPPPENPAVQSGDETVLLVEDEAAVCTLVRDTLEELGYSVHEARNGMAALTLVETLADPIDLLLTDVVMPNMSGRELAEQLQAKQPGLKVLYMSGYTDDAVVRHGVLTAEMELLQKPFSPSTLASKVRTAIDRHPGSVTLRPPNTPAPNLPT